MGEKEASTTLILVSLNPLVPFREDRGRGKEVWFDRGSQNHKFGKRTPAQSSASYPSYYGMTITYVCSRKETRRSIDWFCSEASFRPSSSIQHHRRNHRHAACATTGAGNHTGAGEKQINLERDVVEGCDGSRTERQKNCRDIQNSVLTFAAGSMQAQEVKARDWF
ncbi:hypothetical protein MUK42_30583 [Musa troglodytarum]|uniref:Uncharacterized protein n=1 Tax=Musa troglodytarum TaxID=320322 RepID=A0A9E7FQR8_9LILI|nr:hypothetical protein MUK42_30583 [Musa troglodytarum]